MAYCKKCGIPLKKKDEFCPLCGTPADFYEDDEYGQKKENENAEKQASGIFPESPEDINEKSGRGHDTAFYEYPNTDRLTESGTNTRHGQEEDLPMPRTPRDAAKDNGFTGNDRTKQAFTVKRLPAIIWRLFVGSSLLFRVSKYGDPGSPYTCLKSFKRAETVFTILKTLIAVNILVSWFLKAFMIMHVLSTVTAIFACLFIPKEPSFIPKNPQNRILAKARLDGAFAFVLAVLTLAVMWYIPRLREEPEFISECVVHSPALIILHAVMACLTMELCFFCIRIQENIYKLRRFCTGLYCNDRINTAVFVVGAFVFTVIFMRNFSLFDC